ncbi:MAG TPA: aminotransferase class I/II-fold pyridoxal phosphate-dependent enzyme [Dehalococcoidia bacterium]|nr:aminotransferase class I/II-fold pyridoxal phosphate-dependent enzyme [Dehalococcoidia bacterium]
MDHLNRTLSEFNVGETMIRKMTRLANEHGAVNLSQGFADYDTPDEVKEAAVAAIRGGYNQYSYTFGVPELRAAIAQKALSFNGIEAIDPEDIVVTLGATEAIMTVLKTVSNPGDEVVFFEPFHEAYVPQCQLLGLTPRTVTIDPLSMTYDAQALEDCISDRTVAILLNTPHNPTGKVFGLEELEHIADLARRRNLLVITDEIYEHIVYGGARHISIATLPGMRERTFTTNALSKTYVATGWRVGWVICPPAYTQHVRVIHDVSVIQAPTPLQIAGVSALSLPDSYYEALPEFYQVRRDLLLEGLREAGFVCSAPAGSYYIMAGFSRLDSDSTSLEFAMRLLTESKVAAVPGSNFYLTPGRGEQEVRFAFCKRLETIERAVANLRSLSPAKSG